MRASIFCSLPDTSNAAGILSSRAAAAALSVPRSALCRTQISHLAPHTASYRRQTGRRDALQTRQHRRRRTVVCVHNRRFDPGRRSSTRRLGSETPSLTRPIPVDALLLHSSRQLSRLRLQAELHTNLRGASRCFIQQATATQPLLRAQRPSCDSAHRPRLPTFLFSQRCLLPRWRNRRSSSHSSFP